MKKLLAVALLSLMVTGCAQQSFKLNDGVTVNPKETKLRTFLSQG